MTALVLNQGASWWIGTASMLPFVLIGGYVIVKKTQRFDLFWTFIAVALAVIVGHTVLGGASILSAFNHVVLSSALFFFASIMLTEPMTTPPSRTRRVLYGALVGGLFAPFLHLGPFYSTPELALLVGNLFAYIVSPKQKLLLKLRNRVRLTRDTFDFIFIPDRPLAFTPGQYLEWTLAHAPSDSRGIRRYFTIASSPRETGLHLGVKFYEKGSSFKKKLLSLGAGDTIVASQLAGEFVLPIDTKKKLVLIAGGIGITPFRSMIQDLLDKDEHRSIVLLYINKTPADVAYHQTLTRAEEEIGLETIYSFTRLDAIPKELQNAVGKIDAAVIRREVPDYRERTFYISGAQGMVATFTRMLEDMDVSARNIKTDFFPGLV